MGVQKGSRFSEELNLRNFEGQMFPPSLVAKGASEGGRSSPQGAARPQKWRMDSPGVAGGPLGGM